MRNARGGKKRMNVKKRKKKNKKGKRGERKEER